MFNKIIKGDYGYLKKKRAKSIVLTILYFSVALSIFAAGYISTGTKRNLFTVVAVLGCLPACKSAVNMIMLLIARGCSLKVHEIIVPHEGNLIPMYDMYFTSYNKNYDISHMVVNNKRILAFSEDSKIDCDLCIEHIGSLLKQAGHKNVTVVVLTDLEKYTAMLDNISKQDSEDMIKDDNIRISLYEISL